MSGRFLWRVLIGVFMVGIVMGRAVGSNSLRTPPQPCGAHSSLDQTGHCPALPHCSAESGSGLCLDRDAYGIIAELRYARVSTRSWFVYGLTREEDRLVNQSSARAALEQVLHGDEQQRRTKSPLEAKFYAAAKNCLDLTPQVEIGPYQVDFALLDQKVVIEIDGHEYHKTREQR